MPVRHVAASELVQPLDEEVYEDFSMVTPWEKSVGQISESLRKWAVNDTSSTSKRGVFESTKKKKRDEVASSSFEMEGDSYRLCYLRSRGCRIALEPPSEASDLREEFGRGDERSALLSPPQDDDDDTEALRAAMRTYFGLGECVVLSKKSSEAEGYASSGFSAAARSLVKPVAGGALEAAASAAAGAIWNDDSPAIVVGLQGRCATLLGAGVVASCEAQSTTALVVVLPTNDGALVQGAIAAQRDSRSCCDFRLDRVSDENWRLPRILEEIEKRVGAPLLSATAAARFSWLRERKDDDDDPWTREEVSVEWRAPKEEQDKAELLILRKLLAGREGEKHSGLRRGVPLWGPLKEPQASIALRVTWPPQLTSGILDDDKAAFGTFSDATKTREGSWHLGLRFQDSSPAPRHEQEDDSEDEEDEDDLPLAKTLRTLVSALSLASRAPEAMLDIQFMEQVEAELIAEQETDRWTSKTALELVARRKTLSTQRCEAFLEDIFDEEQEDDEEAGLLACGLEDGLFSRAALPREMASVLAMRLGGLSSLEAIISLWRSVVLKLRSTWEARERIMPKTANLYPKRQSSRETSAFYVGGIKLEAEVARRASTESLAFGGDLRRHIALLDACCSLASEQSCEDTEEEEEDDEEEEDEEEVLYDASSKHNGGFKKLKLMLGGKVRRAPVQLAPLPLSIASHEAAVLRDASQPQEAQDRGERLVLARLASDMATFKDANPESVFADFVRSTAPECWVDSYDEEEEEEDEEDVRLVWRPGDGGAVCGRAVVESTWVDLWRYVAPTHARDCSSLVDVEREAEWALDRLESASALWILRELLGCAAATAVMILRKAARSEKTQTVAELPSVRGSLEVLTATAQKVLASQDNASLIEAGEALVDATKAAERHLAKATSLVGRLAQVVPDLESRVSLTERLLASSLITVDDAGDRKAAQHLVKHFNHQMEDEAMEPPDLREYTVWAATALTASSRKDEQLPCRCYAAITERQPPDTTQGTRSKKTATLAFAISRLDD